MEWIKILTQAKKMTWVKIKWSEFKINISQTFMVCMSCYFIILHRNTVSYVDYDLVVRTNLNKLYSYSLSRLIYFVPLS